MRTSIMARRLLSLAVGVILALTATANVASAHPWHVVKWGNVKTGRCLQTFGGIVVTDVCGRVSTEWSRQGHTGLTKIIEYTGQFCLDSDHQGRVYTIPCNGGDFQLWRMSASPTLTIVNHATSRCLDSNEAGQVYTLPCNGGQFQRWLEIAVR